MVISNEEKPNTHIGFLAFKPTGIQWMETFLDLENVLEAASKSGSVTTTLVQNELAELDGYEQTRGC